MKILLAGATGFIGQALAEALLAAGHQLVCVLREPARFRLRAEPPFGALAHVTLDFSQALRPTDWAAALVGVDVVINTVGIFHETPGRDGKPDQMPDQKPGQRFDVIHTRAPIALFDAAAAARVRFVLQVSALGADADAQSAFHLSKRAADDHLRQLGLPALIAQPSLVYGPGGASATLFNALAALPVLVLPRLPPPGVQPVLLNDVVQGMVRVLAELEPVHPPHDPLRNRTVVPGLCRTVAFVGPEAMSMATYLARLRRALGWQRQAWLIEVSLTLLQRLARAVQRLPAAFSAGLGAGLLNPDALKMLARGNAADSQAFTRLLGRAPLGVESFIAPEQAMALRQSAVLSLWQPVLRWGVALVWLWTGVVSLGLYPVQDSLALLARVGAHDALAWLLLYSAAGLDLALGVLTLAAPTLPARWRGLLWGAQLLLIAGYTALISWRLPEFWLHPYGPLLKNLPMLAAIGLLWSLEPPRQRSA